VEREAIKKQDKRSVCRVPKMSWANPAVDEDVTLYSGHGSLPGIKIGKKQKCVL
jgi:hypothetical protein